jgi:crotonobetainyl-CoA:carnitine CoA-transferase CaiB-like acyl-CoA transferase
MHDDDAVGLEWRRFLDADKQVAADDALSGADLFLTDDESECEALLERHEESIVVCLTPFGAGPYEHLAADEAILCALCGLADATPGFPDHREEPNEPPVQSLAPLAQAAAALTAANAGLAALLARTGGGAHARRVEVSAYEAAVSMMTYEWAATSYGGTVRGRRPGPADLEPNCYVPCRDGMVVVVAFGDSQWQSLVEVMGSPAWAEDLRFATGQSRTAHSVELRALIAAWAQTQDGADILVAAQTRGVPCAPCFTLEQTLASDHLRETQAVRALGDGPIPADPAIVDGERRGAPSRGTRRAKPEWRAAATPARPLAGVRVLDLTQYVAGPFAGQCLAALGAEVVLVETSTHSPSRNFGPFAGEPRHDAGATFNHHNRGKRSVLLNLKREEARSILAELVSESDVVLENFSLRAAEKLGLTYEALSEQRPDIVLGSISGLGRRGPWGSFVALHSGAILLSGLADATRDEEGRPRLVGSTYPDPLTGAYLALLVQQALAWRTQTGRGAHVEVSMLDVALTCLGGLVRRAQSGALDRHPVRFEPAGEPGRYVAVSGDRSAPVLDIAQVMGNEHLQARGFVVADTHPIAAGKPLPAVPWLFDGIRPTLAPAPLRGEHTRAILGELAGVGARDAELLELDGVLV